MENLLQNLINWLVPYLTLSAFQIRLLNTALIILILWLLRLIILKIVTYETDNIRIRYHWRKWTTYVTVVFGLIWVGRIWLVGTESIFTFLGLVAAGLTLTLRGPINDLVGWLYLIWRKPFQVGDRIQVGQTAGDVIDIRTFKFTVLEISNWVEADQSTGRIMHLPNRLAFNEVVANYTQGFEYIWNEIPVQITFESNWQQAKQLLHQIIDRHSGDVMEQANKQLQQASRHFLILYPTLTPIVYTKVNAYGIRLTIRYLCAARGRRSSEQAIWEDILHAFAQHLDINFAYPTQRFYYRPFEDQSANGIPPVSAGPVPQAISRSDSGLPPLS